MAAPMKHVTVLRALHSGKQLCACRGKPRPFTHTIHRFRSISTTQIKNKGLVLGVYEPENKEEDLILSKASQEVDKQCSGKLSHLLKSAGRKLKKGGCRVLYDVDPKYSSVAVCCVGKKTAGFNELEQVDEGRENVRSAIAGGLRQLREVGENQVSVDPCGCPEAAAEGSHLGLHVYDELKSEDKKKTRVDLSCFTEFAADSFAVESQWKQGSIQAEGQNWARYLMEMPANKLTPTAFADKVTNRLHKLNCDVHVREKGWIESEKMGAFLSVARGSVESPLFLEIDYKGATSDTPVALVGKGITFDSGGISIKPSANMDAMRADMGGAACTVGALYTIAKLKLPVFVKAFIPLCENMPSGSATRPGDVVTARSGKTIQVDNTDAEGRLILADALDYAESFKPQLILDMATLTGAIDVALGSGAAGAYTNSSAMWDLLQKSGSVTGDRLWRMPLFNHYSKQVTESDLADLNNIGKYSRAGGSCTAAAFLREFVETKNWIHLDIAGVMSNKDEVPYLGKGMAGRPTRTVVDFVRRLASKK